MRVCLPVALVALITAYLMPVPAPAREPCGISEAVSGDWRIETQAGSDIDPQRLRDLIDRIAVVNANIHCVLIVRHGALVFEHYRSSTNLMFNSAEAAHEAQSMPSAL